MSLDHSHLLIARTDNIGDVVLTLPVVQAPARAWPEAALHYWVKEEYADVVRFEPAIAHVRTLEKGARRLEDLVSMSAELEDCDLIVDLHGNLRTRILTLRQKAPRLRARSDRLLRARWVHARWTRPKPAPHALARYGEALAPLALTTSGPPRVEAGAEAEAWAGDWLAAWDGGRAPIALAPAARHFSKRWPEERWMELDVLLAARGHDRLYFSLAKERDAMPALAARVAAEPRARWVTEPLPRMAALLSRSAGAVTNDSGLMHLAAARGIRVVAMFGSTAPELGFAPVGEGHVVLCRHEPCQPCTLHGRPECPLGHFRCMRGIAADEVAARIDEIVAT